MIPFIRAGRRIADMDGQSRLPTSPEKAMNAFAHAAAESIKDQADSSVRPILRRVHVIDMMSIIFELRDAGYHVETLVRGFIDATIQVSKAA